MYVATLIVFVQIIKYFNLEKYPIHGSEVPLDILQPNSGLQDVALVRANICQQLLNLGGCKIASYNYFLKQGCI